MHKFIFSIILSVIITACSGGGGGSGGNNSGGTTIVTPVISGTVATGAAFVGVVNTYGSKGGSIENTAIDASGHYSVTVSNLTAPYLLCAVPNDPVQATLCSWAASAPGTVNITAMTSLALYYANGEQDPASLVNTWQTNFQTVSDNLPDAQAVVNANFVGVFYAIDPALDIDFTTYDFFTSPFSIGDAYDQILELLDVDLGSQPPVITVNNVAFPFDPNIDTSNIDIGGIGTNPSGLGGLTISGLDTPAIGTGFLPAISGTSMVQDKVAVAWENLDATGFLTVQSEAGQIAYLIYTYGDIVQGSVAIPVDSYINLVDCSGVVNDNCNSIQLDTNAKTLTLNNVQLSVPLDVGVPNQATGPIEFSGLLHWK